MPYIATRRLYHIVGKKMSKYFLYRKAKRLCHEISRDIADCEARFARGRLSHSA